MPKIYEADYAGHTVRFSFRHSATYRYFRTYIRPSNSESYDVRAEEAEIERLRADGGSRASYAEYRCLIGLTAREILKYRCCIFHSASFLYKEKAFLITGPSGIGKSTQYFNWQALYPGEITMISGDMPVLEKKNDGTVWVHPTSWNGKENVGNKIIGQAGGIVLLEQGAENRIDRLSAYDAVLPVLKQFLVRPETEAQIRSLAEITDQVLRGVPVWKMTNTGDLESTMLLRQTLSGTMSRGKGT